MKILLIMIEDIILNLNTISKIEQYDKLLVNYGTLYIDPYSKLRGLRRKWQGHNRYDMLKFVSSTIRLAINYGNSILHRFRYIPDLTLDDLDSLQKDELMLLYKTLLECRSGLSELCSTYKDDKNVLSSIEIVETSIENFIDECNNIGLRNSFFKEQKNPMEETISF